MREEPPVLTDTPPSARGGPTLVVIGTGGLARGLCYALAVTAGAPLDVVVVGRSPERAAEVCYVASARAALAGAPVTFRPRATDLSGGDALAELLSALAPAGLVLAASSQSPWERATAPSAWTALVQRAGFGLTLPFQAESALRAGRALAAARPGAWFLNGCFPDAVNPILAAAGVPVLSGIGNAGLMAAGIQAALGLPDQRDLRVLAHHVHLHAPHGDCEEARAWVGGEPVPGVGSLLAAQRAADRAELNHVTGLAAAVVVRGLLTGEETHTSLPGPLGLPGGYPVLLRGGRLELRLPAGLDLAGAVAFNQRAAAYDGVVVDGDRVRFTEPAAPELPREFTVAEIEPVTGLFHEFRARLRERSPHL
ncbi:potassium transporter TrkA [Bailinhaonella thermotolerans]|uniref:Potassium transporter TrkA n=1 Tax=Bailinhaonella thermotolerans TaxID=1070861 RepID=A0A3A4APV5_9ACTN|nr:potassium transporter TrkA [Bailinhaonella thermotolerans]RJL21440.1 potassium transporter TrkA [Bailinhaonella thermotolerans]